MELKLGIAGVYWSLVTKLGGSGSHPKTPMLAVKVPIRPRSHPQRPGSPKHAPIRSPAKTQIKHMLHMYAWCITLYIYKYLLYIILET